LIVLSVLLLAAGLTAQVRTGNIYGTITDTEGNPLPGVTVTLTSSILAPLTTVTSEQGIYRFPSLSPSSDYVVTAELQGFKRGQKTGIIVTVGSNVEINLTLEQGALEEEVTVVAITPIVDTKKTATSMNVTKEEMQSLPTARDPWVVMQLAPSIMLDRENVGGNESGQQAAFLARGDSANNQYWGSNNIWAVDGIDITDPAALGGSALYYDFDMFEELNITTGGADVSVQTGGIALNMVTRRGGNKTNLAGRFYVTDRKFQANNLTDELKAEGVRNINKIEIIKDYGFNAGGPILKDKLWWWAAYGVQDIFTYTVYNTQDKTLLNNYNGKINAQLFSGNRFEALVTAGAKEKLGRDASVAMPEGNHQTGKYHFGSPIFKVQDEQVFGNNFFFALKYSFNDAGFGWTPMVDEGLQGIPVYNQTTKAYVAYNSSYPRSWGWYMVSRPRNNYQATASYFNDSLFGVSHEFKAGFEYSDKEQAGFWSNFQDMQIYRNYNTPEIDLNLDGTKDIPTGWQRFRYYREGTSVVNAKQYAGYFQDTITAGRFTFILGLRYDNQIPYSKPYSIPTVKSDVNAWKIVDSATQDAMERLLPAIEVEGIEPDYQWKTWSPRIGMTWDITGDGKTIFKASVASYGDIMGVGKGVSAPLGTGGTVDFWWNDNGDQVLSFNELYWIFSAGAAQKYQAYRVFDDAGNFIGNKADGRQAGMYSGVDLDNPTVLDYNSATEFYADDAKRSSRTRELLLTVEREILPDFGASINFTFRRYDDFEFWNGYFPDTGEIIGGADEFRQGGTVPSTVGGISTGEAAGKPWYTYREDISWWDYYYISAGDQYNDYWGVDFVITKRLSNKWFLNASFTLQDQKGHWGSNGGDPWEWYGWGDPTNKWAFDGQPYAFAGGGASGKTAINMYSKWLFKLSGLYQLPWDINISGTFLAREGWKIPNYFDIYDYNLSGLDVSNRVYVMSITGDPLPTFYNLTLRLEKMVKIGDGRLYIMADMFNVLNSDIVNRAYDANFGSFYVAEDLFVPEPTNRLLNEILNPRVTRFGVRFQF
jgi:hypothetical protein